MVKDWKLKLSHPKPFCSYFSSTVVLLQYSDYSGSDNDDDNGYDNDNENQLYG